MILSFEEFLLEHKTTIDIFIERWEEDLGRSDAPLIHCQNMGNPQAIKYLSYVREIDDFYEIEPAFIIDNVFTWSDTQEGYHFWADISNSWALFCEDNELAHSDFPIMKQFNENSFTSAIAKDAHLEFDKNIV